MKIREVCDKTGLTERAVRLYLEKGLLCPQSEWRQGRTYTEYRESDVKRLREIAALRSVGFSLEEIGAMRQNGADISAFLEKRIDREKSAASAGSVGTSAEASHPGCDPGSRSADSGRRGRMAAV